MYFKQMWFFSPFADQKILEKKKMVSNTENNNH